MTPRRAAGAALPATAERSSALWSRALWSRAPRSSALLLTAVLVVASCSSGGDGQDASSAPDTGVSSREAVEAADGVCGVLVDFDHTVADAVNGASRQITGQSDADEARRLLLEATDTVQQATDRLPDDYAALGLGDEGDIGRLIEDASARAGDVTVQLDLIRTTLTDELVDEGPRAILTATFIHYEKVQSLAQPEVDDYHDQALVDALNDRPDCEHTISR